MHFTAMFRGSGSLTSGISLENHGAVEDVFSVWEEEVCGGVGYEGGGGEGGEGVEGAGCCCQERVGDAACFWWCCGG